MKLYTYNSLAAFTVDAKKGGLGSMFITRGIDAEHYGGSTPAEAAAYVLRGASDKQMRRAREIMDKVDVSFHDRAEPQWVPSMCGAYPIVGEYLMGVPEHMRARIPVESDTSPVKLVFEVGVSQGISVEQIAITGAAVAALAMRMSETRPVELWAMSANKSARTNTDVVAMTKLDVSPVSLSQCVAVFGTPQMGRMLSFSHLKFADGDYGSGVGWALGRPSEQRVSDIRKACQLAPQDIILQGAYLPDRKLIQHDPVKWVHKQIEKQRSMDNE
jgi:hypothetical protein